MWVQAIFFLFYISSLSFFSCQAVTAVEKGQGGTDSVVSVAHKLHLIGAGLMDRGPGVSQGHQEQAHTRILPLYHVHGNRGKSEWRGFCN